MGAILTSNTLEMFAEIFKDDIIKGYKEYANLNIEVELHEDTLIGYIPNKEIYITLARADEEMVYWVDYHNLDEDTYGPWDNWDRDDV